MIHAIDQLSTSLTSQAFRALNRVVLPLARAGWGSPLPVGVGVVVLETTGRVSREPRQVPLIAARIGRHVHVSTVRPSSQWLKNLEAEPDVSVWVGGRKRAASGQVTPGILSVACLSLDGDEPNDDSA